MSETHTNTAPAGTRVFIPQLGQFGEIIGDRPATPSGRSRVAVKLDSTGNVYEFVFAGIQIAD